MGHSQARRPLHDVIQHQTEHLMAIPGVVGIAEGEWEGQPCIRVLVSTKTRELEIALPNILEGYPVRILEAGDIKAL